MNDTQLTARVERVPYPREGIPIDGPTWMIVVTDATTCKGKLPYRPDPGDTLMFSGRWTTYQGNREFAFQDAMLCVPENERDKLHYVVTRTIGMGPAMEDAIWQAKGDAWRELAVGDIPRLSAETLVEFMQQATTLQSKVAEVETVATLMGKGATQAMAQAAWKKWEHDTLGLVAKDPYQLAELGNYGFGDVDKRIRREYGIGDDDPRRMKAATLYAMRRLTSDGDTVVEWKALRDEAVGMVANAKGVVDATRTMLEDGRLCRVQGSSLLCLADDWKNESDIIEWMEGATAT